MKIITTSVLCLILHLGVYAQQPEALVLTVKYDFMHVYDTANRANPVRETMYLLVGQTSSAYRRSPAAPFNKPDATPAVSGGRPTITVSGMPMAVVSAPGISEGELFQYPAAGVFKNCIHIAMNDYLVEDKLPVINWKVGTDTKTIGDFNCQQATGRYAGRTYTVWFAPDLPFRNGPWKLNGLPGLILEAKDATGDVAFTFSGFTKADSGQVTTFNKTRLITTNQKALNRVREAFDESPVATMQAQLPAGSPAPALAYRLPSGKTVRGEEAQELIEKKRKSKNPNNNPLELK
ncbi:GLPGLI family protein [Paraflavitalea speifideaquila]|uniref:GLPGLI family protein n=1 Tax=Paraflavitalea speifideaquila TaxID=3076558 RepID=UPI0028E40F46|nr:GLPGLI family protein [Paraflavitalea speifideiaquila]